MKLLISYKENNRNYEAVLHCLSSIVEKSCNRDPRPSNKVSSSATAEELSNFLSRHLQDFIRVSLDARCRKNTGAYQLSTTIIRTLLRVAGESRQQELINTFWNERVQAIDLAGLVAVNVTPVRPSSAIVYFSVVKRLSVLYVHRHTTSHKL
jgi:hypothetical protein